MKLKLDAGIGPFLVVVTAIPDTNDDETGELILGTRDLTTGEPPVVGKVKTIISFESLNAGRVYATPLTTLAVDIAINGRGEVTDNLDSAQIAAKAFFGFGMNPDIDIFNTPPILDETTDTPELQQQVAEYRAATETFAAVIGQLVENQAFG